jgi:hypothetical protein
MHSEECTFLPYRGAMYDTNALYCSRKITHNFTRIHVFLGTQNGNKVSNVQSNQTAECSILLFCHKIRDVYNFSTKYVYYEILGGNQTSIYNSLCGHNPR